MRLNAGLSASAAGIVENLLSQPSGGFCVMGATPRRFRFIQPQFDSTTAGVCATVKHGLGADRTDYEARSPRHAGPRLLGYRPSRLACAISRARVRFLCDRRRRFIRLPLPPAPSRRFGKKTIPLLRPNRLLPASHTRLSIRIFSSNRVAPRQSAHRDTRMQLWRR
jgi:hypothetical protein